MVMALLAVNFMAVIIATFSANILSWMKMTEQGAVLGFTNQLLIIVFVDIALSIIIAGSIKTVRTEPWLTGYGKIQEISKQRGEIFTLWKEILHPLYTIRVPDEKISRLVGKVHPVILMVTFILLAYFLR
jgi:hypothetical protein